MTDDTGFAPNPFHGFMTLANCKSEIRRIKNPILDKNLYIAGFTSNQLCGEKVGEETLVFLMKVQEKVTYKEYFTNIRFQCKIPNNNNGIGKAGDNIYQPDHNEQLGFKQLENYNHDCGNIKSDLKGLYVLISNEFYYFGSGAIPVNNLGLKIPSVQAGHGVKSPNFQALLDYLEQNKFAKNIAIHPPHKWKENEPFN